MFKKFSLGVLIAILSLVAILFATTVMLAGIYYDLPGQIDPNKPYLVENVGVEGKKVTLVSGSRFQISKPVTAEIRLRIGQVKVVNFVTGEKAVWLNKETSEKNVVSTLQSFEVHKVEFSPGLYVPVEVEGVVNVVLKPVDNQPVRLEMWYDDFWMFCVPIWNVVVTLVCMLGIVVVAAFVINNLFTAFVNLK